MSTCSMKSSDLKRILPIANSVDFFEELFKMTVKAPPYKHTIVLLGNINFSREHLACIETGKEFISLRKLFLIADTLGVSLKQLIDFD